MTKQAGKPAKLTAKQERFVQEYMKDLNATQAAIRAGYSAKTAKEIGCQNLAKLHIAEAIERLQAKVQKKNDVSIDRIVQEYARLGFSDVRDLVDWDGANVQLKPSEDLSDDAAACVSEVSVTAQGVKIKLHDKKAALDSLAKHLGMFEERPPENNLTVVNRIELVAPEGSQVIEGTSERVEDSGGLLNSFDLVTG